MITKDMTFQEVVARYPKTVSIFERYGLGCCGCLASEFEDLESGAMVHGVKIEDLLVDLNAQRLLEQ
jgi:hybrid cluster-associated redox disulfide protein